MTLTTITFTNREDASVTGTLIKRQGAMLQVRVGEDLIWVKKTQVTAESVAEAHEAPRGGFAAAAAEASSAAEHAAEKPAKAKRERKTQDRDPDEVCLKDLCEELGIIPRIARKKLRKEFGTLEKQESSESRWCWKANSEDLAKVRSILSSVDTMTKTELQAAAE